MDSQGMNRITIVRLSKEISVESYKFVSKTGEKK